MTTSSGHTQAIRVKKVLGAAVKDSAGDKIGHIEDVVLDKTTNNIMFAVVGFGGVAGIGEKFHPIPWSSLDYDKSEDAYVVALTKEQLKQAPADTIEQLTASDGQTYRDRSYSYYGATPYWS